MMCNVFGQNDLKFVLKNNAGMLVVVRRCVPMMLVLLALLAPCHSLTSPGEEEVAPASQEALGFIASLQQPNEMSSNELNRIANMYELLQLAAVQQQHQRQRLADLVDERDEPEELPEALPLHSHLAAVQDKDEYLKDKRGSYMSLCHFKICNMGRKRSPYWNTWGRN